MQSDNRLPDHIIGDLMAMVAAARMSEERLVEVISDAGIRDAS